VKPKERKRVKIENEDNQGEGGKVIDDGKSNKSGLSGKTDYDLDYKEELELNKALNMFKDV